MNLPFGFNAGPSTLYLGEPETAAAVPVWPWVLAAAGVVALVVLGVAVFTRIQKAKQSPAAHAADKLVVYYKVDPKTRRALDGCALQLELKSSAGLLLSPTALAEAIGRCDSMKEADKSRLRELAIRVAQARAGRSISTTA